jgi:large-conductance mechanosensitive channel
MAEGLIGENITEVLQNQTSSSFNNINFATIKSVGDLRNLFKKRNLSQFILLIIISALVITLLSSFLKNIIFPPINLLLSKLDIPDWKIILRNAKGKNKEISIKIGDFIETSIVSIIIISLTIWASIKLSDSHIDENLNNIDISNISNQEKLDEIIKELNEFKLNYSKDQVKYV